ncbi:AN1-type zinc finger protein 2A [Pleurodeles waltl]|uniref:AN1-type zinc finger protein 2A n=1 Tax=Pleurodeles waltl TaxID=8319 RepID=UPI003709A183
MEFPDLGKHCSEKTCKQLDFLPFKCDACKDVFCKNHFKYDQHKCISAYKKDIQVPVCPMCNVPIPVKKGEVPDVVVGEHIARSCKSDSQRKHKIFKNKCLKPGCKRKELIKVVCDHCQENFCIKHRHPSDHSCRGSIPPLSKAGRAAIVRAEATSDAASAVRETPTHQPYQPISASVLPRSCGMSYAATWQKGLSEEEVLKRVLELSLAEATQSHSQTPSFQQEDAASQVSSTSLDECIQSQSKKKAVTGK